ncbi:hypothetical protein FRC11_008863 [Ceratobasidium sp. 423]|nr:hypothetical protein FRC11_008863 [Ceratobasidium sp. 423]
MKGFEDALAFAQIKSTNPEHWERPWYMPWIHTLLTRSNAVDTSYLWTSAEFPVGVGRGTSKDIFTRAKAEANLQDPVTSDDSDTPFDSMFYVPPSSLVQTPMKHAKKRKHDASHQSPQTAPPKTPLGKYKFIPPVSFPTTQGDSPISHPEASHSVKQQGNSSTEVTPARSQRDDTFSGDEHWQKIYRTRIVDFAVVYLLRDQKELVKIDRDELHGFRQIKVPIVVEGKRSPALEAPGAEFERELLALLVLAQVDIDRKRLFFFEAYPCISFIGIAFAGSYWTFTICESNSLEWLSWSKPISMESDAHAFVLDVIFTASEDLPENPGGHTELQEILTKHIFMPGAPFGFAELN